MKVEDGIRWMIPLQMNAESIRFKVEKVYKIVWLKDLCICFETTYIVLLEKHFRDEKSFKVISRKKSTDNVLLF